MRFEIYNYETSEKSYFETVDEVIKAVKTINNFEITDTINKREIKADSLKSRVRQLREHTGLSMKEFSKEYNIPYRTLQDWESCERIPTDWTIDLLARAVYSDRMSRNIEFTVVSAKKGDEFTELVTRSLTQAVKAAEGATERGREAQVLIYVNDIHQNNIYEEEDDDRFIPDLSMDADTFEF